MQNGCRNGYRQCPVLPRCLLAIFATLLTSKTSFVSAPQWTRSVRVARRAEPLPESKSSVDLMAGKSYNAKVDRLHKQGAVLDLGVDKPGFMHISQIRDEFIKDINDVLQVGDEIQVRIRRHRGFDVEATMRDSEIFQKRPPWEFSPGDEVEGSIAHLVKADWKKKAKSDDEGWTLVDVGAMVVARLPRSGLKDDPAQLVKGQTLKLRIVKSTGCTLEVEQI